MNVNPAFLSLTSLGIFALVFAGGSLGLHLKNRVYGLGFRDTLTAMSYLTKYDAALEYHGLRRREVRARVDELRATLAESAADGGVAAALHRLGPPRVLAAEVAGDRTLPSWSRGMQWVAAAVAVGVLTLLISASAFLAAVESAVAPGVTATWSAFLVTITATSAPSSTASFTVELSLATLALLLVPFGLGARVWRLWTGRR